MRRAAGIRLVDGVLIAAVALLALKALGILSWLVSEPAPLAPGELPPFARVLAHARSNYEPGDVTTTGSTTPKEEAHAPAAAAPSPPVPTSPAIVMAPPSAERVILERLAERREELRRRDRDAETREKLLEDTERRLEARAGDLKALQAKIEPGGAEKKAEAEIGLKNIVTMYESMKPKDAARVFDRLPQAVLVAVVMQMNPRKMSEVLAAMSPAGAEKLTVALANRGQPQAPPEAALAGLPAGELPSIEAPPRR